MPTSRSSRSYPLTLKSSGTSPINAGIVAAYDYQGNPASSYAGGDGAAHVGTNHLTSAGSPTLVTVTADISGRDCSEGKTVLTNYGGANFGALGIGSVDGKANFSIHRRMRTPATHTGTTAGRIITAYRDASSPSRLVLTMVETSTYCYFRWELIGNTIIVPASSVAGTEPFRIPFNTIVDLHFTRNGDTVSAYLNGALAASTEVPALTTFNTNGTGYNGPITGNPCDIIMIDETYWNRALTGAEVTAHQADPYAGYNSSVTIPTGTITSQPTPDGQSQRFVGTTTNATNGTYTLSGSGGGQTVGPLPFTITSNAFDFTHTGLMPGDYSPTLTISGSGGTGGVTGTAAFSIVGVGGGGELVNDPGDTVNPTITGSITVSQIKESSFAASWPAATDNVGIAGYEYSLGGAYLPLGLVTSHIFTAQQVGSTIALSIRAFDSAGLRSNALAAASFSTLPAQIPAPPTAIVATLGLAGAVSVAFVPDPTVIDNPTTGYTLKASNGQQASGTASPITITMPLGFTGTFTVSATNAIGTSAESAASNQIVIASPTAPEGDSQDPVLSGGITIDLLTHDTIGVSWQGATDNVGIRNYEVTFDGVNFTNNGTATSVIKTGLKALTGYPFSVRANDDAGNTSDPLAVLIETLEAPAPVLPAFVPSSPASTRSYAWLKDAITRWSHRDNLGLMMDDFIMLAEKRINGDLQARLQVGATTIRTTANLDGAPLPSDIAEIKALAIPGNPPLEYLPPDAFNAHYLRGETGTPKYYTVFGAYLHLIPTPGEQYDIACAYRQKIPSLLDEADGVNWLISEQPNIYLAACMLEVIDYTKNFAEQDSWTRKYAMAVDAVNGSDWSMASSLRIRTDTRTV